MEPSTPAIPEPKPASSGSLRTTLLTYLLLMLLVLVPLLALLTPYLVSLATGAIVGVLCHPLYLRLRRRLPAWISSLLVTSGVLLLVLVPALAMGIGAFRQGYAAIDQLLIKGVPTIVGSVESVRHWLPFLDALGTPEELQEILKKSLNSLSGAVSNGVLQQIQALPVLILQLALVTLSIYFSLVDGRALFNWVGDKIPLSLQIRNMLGASFKSATNAVVLASLAAAGSQAMVIFIGFAALRVPQGLLAGGLTFLLGWIPGLPTLVWGSAVIYLYSEGSIARAIIMVAIGLVVGVVDNIVRALVLRGQKAIHPMVSLVAILGGIAVFGVAGVFLGPLIACMAFAVLEIWPAVASYCGIAVRGAGDLVPNVPMLSVAEPAASGAADARPQE